MATDLALHIAATPISDVRGSKEYRQAMLTVMTERTWLRAIERLETSGRTGSSS